MLSCGGGGTGETGLRARVCRRLQAGMAWSGSEMETQICSHGISEFGGCISHQGDEICACIAFCPIKGDQIPVLPLVEDGEGGPVIGFCDDGS